LFERKECTKPKTQTKEGTKKINKRRNFLEKKNLHLKLLELFKTGENNIEKSDNKSILVLLFCLFFEINLSFCKLICFYSCHNFFSLYHNFSEPPFFFDLFQRKCLFSSFLSQQTKNKFEFRLQSELKAV